MYRNAIISQLAPLINHESHKNHVLKYGQTKLTDKLNESVERYGANLMIKCQELENVC